MPRGDPSEPMLRRGMKAAGQLDTLPQLKKGLGSPALFGIVQGFIGASVYFAVGVVAAKALGLTWAVFAAGALFFAVLVPSYV
jgi:basic amino acid/polyamine antiporter, APA family